MRSYAAFHHKDANHKGIVQELERRGVEVAELMQPLDILAEYAGWTCFLEIKQPGSRAKFTRPQ